MKSILAGFLLAVVLAPACLAQSDLFGVYPFSNDYFVFDRASGASTFAGTLTVAGDTVTGATGAALHPTTREIFVILKTTTGGSNRVLATLDRTTGVCTSIGSLGDSFSAIAFDSAGTLWGVTGDGATTPETLYTIDQGTAVPTFFATLGNGADGEVIAYNPVDGLMYHSSGNGTVVFETINLTTGATTNISTSLGGGETFGLVWDPIAGNFLQVNINSVLSTLTTTGTLSAGATLNDSVVGDVDARGLIILPLITSSVSSLNLGTTSQGTAGTPQSFDVGGTNLWGDITITPPTGVVVSLTMSGGYGPSLTLSPTNGVVATTTVYARIQASAPAGAVTGNIDLTTNGGDTVQIALSGNVISPAEIDVQRPAGTANSIPDGGSDSVSGTVAATLTSVTYTIENLGGTALNLTGGTPVTITNTSNCTAVVSGGQPASPVAISGTVTFQIDITPGVAGAWSFDLAIASDDSDENPYDIAVSGTAVATPAPQLQVDRSSTVVSSAGTDTVFGTVDATLTTLTYTATNIGSALLTFTGGSPVGVTAGTGTPTVAVNAQPGSATLTSGGGNTTFAIDVTPNGAGAWTATVTIASDDPASPYTFTISGSAQAAAAPEINLLRDATTSITDGSTESQTNTGTAAFAANYTIRNEGAATLNLTGTTGSEVVVSNTNNCGVVVTQPGSASIAASGGTTTFTLTITPTAAGAFSFDVSIANDDIDEDPFNWTFSGNTGGSGGGGGGGGDDGGCSTSTDGFNWLALMGLLGVVALGIRMRPSTK